MVGMNILGQVAFWLSGGQALALPNSRGRIMEKGLFLRAMLAVAHGIK
jgi:hypothetical protein